MWPLLTGLVTGGASLLGSMFSSQTSAQNSQLAAQTSLQNNQMQIEAQQKMLGETEQFNADQAQANRVFSSGEADIARQFNAGQAEIQRGYETQMSNTAYQRASADMKAAGLNPAMMFGSGGASSTPSVSAASGPAASGSSASIGTPSVPQAQFAPVQRANPFAGIGDAVSKAVGSAVQAETIDRMVQEIANLKTQAAKTEAETVTEKLRPELVQSQTDKTEKETRKIISEGTAVEARVPQAVFEGTVAKDLLSMPDALRQNLVRWGFAGQKASDVVNPIAHTADSISRFFRR